MFNKLREIGLDNKKLIAIGVAMLLMVILIIFVGVNNFYGNSEDRDLKQASKEVENSGEDSAKDFQKTIEKSSKEDDNIDLSDFKIASQEEVEQFIGTLTLDDNAYDLTDKEFGEGTYDLYTNDLLPKSTDNNLIKSIKQGQIKYELARNKNSDGNFLIPAFNVLDTSNEYILSLNQYAVSGGGFRKLSDAYRIGYTEAGLTTFMLTGKQKSTDNVDTYFKVTFLVYPTQDTTAKKMQEDIDKLPISMGGYTLEPEHNYWKNYDFTKDKGIKSKEYEAYLEYKFPNKSFKNSSSLTEDQDFETLDLNSAVVYSGTPIKFSYVGSVADYFDKNSKAVYDKSSGKYSFETLPKELTIKLGNQIEADVSLISSPDTMVGIPSSN